MRQVVYSSVARGPHLSTRELHEMLGAFRSNNLQFGITGLLLHSHGRFLQLVEGGAAEVDRLIARISADPRHFDLRGRSLTFPGRLFAHWSMAFVDIDAAPHSSAGFAGRSPNIDLHVMDEDTIADLLLHFSNEAASDRNLHVGDSVIAPM
jgi:hypothetical protein